MIWPGKYQMKKEKNEYISVERKGSEVGQRKDGRRARKVGFCPRYILRTQGRVWHTTGAREIRGE